jgi:dethiobiotin synthetase
MTRRGLAVAAMKPIETGVSLDDASRDGARIARAAYHEHLLRTTAPIVMPDPVAPLVAARRVNTTLHWRALDEAMEAASVGRDAMIVEGAGGLLVPITEDATYATLFHRWNLDVILVAANKLGVINHTRLTCAVCRAEGLRVQAIVLNQTAPAPANDVSVADNAAIIAELEKIPVVELPWLADPDDVDLSASSVERSGLLDLLMPAPVLRSS